MQPIENFDDLGILKYDDKGLIGAIIQDAETGDVLMFAFMNANSLKDTLRTGKTHFWSRSRGKYWMKGESSGHTQEVMAVYADCDADVLLIQVHQKGAACHMGYRSCFFRRLDPEGAWQVIAEKVFNPEDVYKDK